MSKVTTTVSSYLRTAYDEESLLDAFNRAFENADFPKYDTMIGTGLSGALVVPVMAKYFDKNWAIVRKPSDSNHAEYNIEGSIGPSWIFVDDFISSGATLVRVFEAMEAHIEQYASLIERYGSYGEKGIETKYVGTLSYLDREFLSLERQYQNFCTSGPKSLYSHLFIDTITRLRNSRGVL